MAKFNSFAIVLLISCLFALSLAIPLNDISSTSIGISGKQTSPSSERIVVAVKRVDDLVNDKGELLAEKVSAIIMNFDLHDDQLLINSVPVQLDVSTIQVIEAQVIPANVTENDVQKYLDNFDIGLVTVNISTVAESLPSEVKDISIRRITVSIRIVEIDGVNVIQTDAVFKVLEFKIYADGSKSSEIIPANNPSNSTSTLPVNSPCGIQSFAARVRHWWRCSSRLSRIVLSSLFLTFIFGIAFMGIPAAIRAIMSSISPQTPYQFVHQDDNDDQVEQVIFITDDEKQEFIEHEKEQK